MKVATEWADLMDAVILIQSSEKIGCELKVEGENIRVMNIKRLPQGLKQQLRENKQEVIDALKRDMLASAAGFMIGLSGTIYTLTLSKNTLVFIEKINERWELWRETYQKDKSQAIGIKLIASGSTFDYTLMKAQGYIDYMGSKS